jgi:hypothetical protein
VGTRGEEGQQEDAEVGERQEVAHHHGVPEHDERVHVPVQVSTQPAKRPVSVFPHCVRACACGGACGGACACAVARERVSERVDERERERDAEGRVGVRWSGVGFLKRKPRVETLLSSFWATEKPRMAMCHPNPAHTFGKCWNPIRLVSDESSGSHGSCHT